MLYFNTRQLHAGHRFVLHAVYYATEHGLSAAVAYAEQSLQAAVSKPSRYQPTVDGVEHEIAWLVHRPVTTNHNRAPRRSRQRVERRRRAD